MADTDWGDVGTSTATGAASGALIGSIVPGVGTLVGAGVGAGLGAVSGYFGGKAGNAAKDAAEERQYQALVAYNRIMASRKQAADLAMNPAAMAAHDQALQTQERNVQRQENLVKSIDPMLIDAGKQAKSILDGKSAPVLQNIKDQRGAQRNQMMDNLRSQLGPGAETSSAGMQAMQKFDLQTSDMLNGAQQQYLDKVSNISINGAATVGDSMNRVTSTLNTIQAQSPEAEAARIMQGYSGAEAGALQGMTEAAGGQHMGDILKAQGQQQFMGQMMQLGGMAMAFGGGRSAATKAGAVGTAEGTQFGPSEPSSFDTAGWSTTPGAAPAASNFGNVARSSNVNAAGSGMTVSMQPAPSYSGPLSPGFGSNYADPKTAPLSMGSFGYRPGAAAGGYTAGGTGW